MDTENSYAVENETGQAAAGAIVVVLLVGPRA